MNKLAMVAAGATGRPTILFKQPNQLPDFHRANSTILPAAGFHSYYSTLALRRLCYTTGTETAGGSD